MAAGGFLVAGVELLVAGVELLAAGIDLLAAGVELLAAGVDLLAAGVAPLAAGIDLLAAGQDGSFFFMNRCLTGGRGWIFHWPKPKKATGRIKAHVQWNHHV